MTRKADAYEVTAMEAVTQGFRLLTDEQLLARARTLVERERSATVMLIACLAVVYERRLYLEHGYSSMYDYSTRALGLSEKEAYGRITAARVACHYPVALRRLADRSLTLTNLTLLAPHLTEENHETLFDVVAHKTKRETEQEIAALHPERPQLVTWHLRVPVDTDAKLRRAKDLLRHAVPSGDAAAVLDRALSLLIADLEKRKLAAVRRPRNPSKAALNSRHIPASVKRAVHKRDAGRCAFVGKDGRCAETGSLEFHHVKPFARGGVSTVDNIQLRCRAHNQYEGELAFGRLVSSRATGKRVRKPGSG